jgi:hypothetical protein
VKNLLLDSWVLSTYSSPALRDRLAGFVISEGFLPIINALTLVEVFNPGWERAQAAERGYLVAALLAEVGAAIVDPRVVVRAEVSCYPSTLDSLPLQLNLAEIPPPLRREVLLRFLRADSLYLEQDKDIRMWADSYEKVKENWPTDRDEILAAAVRQNQIAADEQGHRFPSPDSRIAFLQSLDRRLFGWLTREEQEALGERIVPLFLGDTAKLPAVRLSSLLFVYCYIEVVPGDRQRQLGSDIGDHWHLMTAPYCSAVTADGSMKRVLERLRPEAQLSCTVYGPAELRKALG